jgi:EmrB/QacA subfamily drug resistance transporter
VNKWGILVSVLLGSFTVVLNNSMLNVAVPSFVKLFSISVTTSEWVVIGYIITLVISMTVNSFLTGRYGQKKIYLIGLAIFLIASLLGSFSWNFTSIVVFRMLQGIGGGLVTPLGLTLIYQVFPISERGFAAGVWGVAVMVAPALGPLIGGLLLQYSTWNSLFLVNLPSGLLCALLMMKYLRMKPVRNRVPFDAAGFVSLSGGLVLILTGLMMIQSPAGLSWSLMLIGAGIAITLWFIGHVRRIKHPILDLGIFRNKIYSVCSLIVAVSTGNLFAAVLLIPLLIQEVYQLSPLVSGLILFPQAIVMGLAMTAGGRILDKRGARIIVPAGLAIAGGMTIIFGFSAGATGLMAAVTLLVLRGGGMGLLNTPATTAGMNALEPSAVPQAVAVNNLIQQLSGAVFSVTISLFFESRKAHFMYLLPEKEASLAAIRQSFFLLGLLFVVLIPAALFIFKEQKVYGPVAASQSFIKGKR